MKTVVRPQLQTTPFVPPALKPGDAPGLYGNRIPASYIRELEASRFDPMQAAEDRMMAHIRSSKETRQEEEDDDGL